MLLIGPIALMQNCLWGKRLRRASERVLCGGEGRFDHANGEVHPRHCSRVKPKAATHEIVATIPHISSCNSLETAWLLEQEDLCCCSAAHSPLKSPSVIALHVSTLPSEQGISHNTPLDYNILSATIILKDRTKGKRNGSCNL